jgi:hypothetical protein
MPRTRDPPFGLTCRIGLLARDRARDRRGREGAVTPASRSGLAPPPPFAAGGQLKGRLDVLATSTVQSVGWHVPPAPRALRVAAQAAPSSNPGLPVRKKALTRHGVLPVCHAPHHSRCARCPACGYRCVPTRVAVCMPFGFAKQQAGSQNTLWPTRLFENRRIVICE